MKSEKSKKMSDGEVNDFAFKKLIGDLGGIEADKMFDKEEPKAGGPSLKIEITHSMDGQQTKEKPVVEDEDDEKEELGKLGK